MMEKDFISIRARALNVVLFFYVAHPISATGQVASPKEIETTAEAGRLALKKNTELEIQARGWDVKSVDATVVENVKAGFRIAESRVGEITNNEDINQYLDGIVDEIAKSLKPAQAINWYVAFFGNLTRFKKTYSLEAEIKLKERGFAHEKETEWIYSDQTIYEFGASSEVLRIRPLDPYTDAYPFPVDRLDLCLLGTKKQSALEPELSAVNGAVTRVYRNGKGSIFMEQRRFGDGLASTSLKVLNSEGRTVTERLFGFATMVDAERGGSIPRAALNIQYSNGGKDVLIDLYLIRAVKVGEQKPENYSLTIPRSSKVADEAADVK